MQTAMQLRPHAAPGTGCSARQPQGAALATVHRVSRHSCSAVAGARTSPAPEAASHTEEVNTVLWPPVVAQPSRLHLSDPASHLSPAPSDLQAQPGSTAAMTSSTTGTDGHASPANGGHRAQTRQPPQQHSESAAPCNPRPHTPDSPQVHSQGHHNSNKSDKHDDAHATHYRRGGHQRQWQEGPRQHSRSHSAPPSARHQHTAGAHPQGRKQHSSNKTQSLQPDSHRHTTQSPPRFLQPTRGNRNTMLLTAPDIDTLHQTLASWKECYIDAVHLTATLERLIQLLESLAVARSPRQRSVAPVVSPLPPLFTGAAANRSWTQGTAELTAQQAAEQHKAAARALIQRVVTLAQPLAGSFRQDTAARFLWAMAKLNQGVLEAGPKLPETCLCITAWFPGETTAPKARSTDAAADSLVSDIRQLCERVALHVLTATPQAASSPQVSHSTVQSQDPLTGTSTTSTAAQPNSVVLQPATPDAALHAKPAIPGWSTEHGGTPPSVRADRLATTVWASAQLGLGQSASGPTPLWAHIIQHLRAQGSEMMPKELSLCLWALTHSNMYDYSMDVYETLYARAGELMVEANTQRQQRHAASPAGQGQLRQGGAQQGRPVEGSAGGKQTQNGKPPSPQPEQSAQQQSRSIRFVSQDVSHIIWSLGRTLHPPPPALKDHMEQCGLSVLHTMDAQHMGNIAWGLAMQRLRAPRLMTAIVAQAAARVDSLPVHNIAELVWAASKQHSFLHILGSDDDMDWQYSVWPAPQFLVNERGLLRLAAPRLCAHIDQLSPQHAPMVAWAYARVPPDMAHPLYRVLATYMACGRHLEACDHKGQATLLWSFAKQGAYEEVFADMVLRCISTWPLESVHVNLLHMVLWSVGALVDLGPLDKEGVPAGARLVARHSSTVWRVVVVLFANLQQCGGQEVSNMAWALAQLGATSPQLWDGMSQLVLKARRSYTLPDDALAGPVNADKKAPGTPTGSTAQGRQTRHLPRGVRKLRWALIENQTRKQKYVKRNLIYNLKALECAKLVWSFAKAGHVDEGLFQAVSLRLRALAKEHPAEGGLAPPPGGFSINTVSKTVWAFAMQGLHDDDIFSTLLPYAQASLHHAIPQDVASLMWGLAVSGHGRDDEQLVAGCLKHATSNVSAYSGAQLADMVWSVAALKQSSEGAMYDLLGRAEPLVEHAFKRLVEAPQCFRVEDLARVVWGLSTLGYDRPAAWAAVAQCVTARVRDSQQRTQSGPQEAHAAPQPATASTHSTADDHPAINTAHPTTSAPGPQPQNSSRQQPDKGGKIKLNVGLVNEYLTNSDNTTQSALSICNTASTVDPGSLVTVVYALARLQFFHPALSCVCAEYLLPRLCDLNIDDLVHLVWSYSLVLRPAAMAAQQAVASGKPCPHQRLLAASSKLLSAADQLLEEAAPARHRNRLLPEELRLLWQAHHCCLLWATHQGSRTDLPAHTASTQPWQVPPQLTAPAQHSPFRLHPSHMQHYLDTCSMQQPKLRKQRVRADIVYALDSLGYSAMGPATAKADDVLAGSGPEWLGAEQGHVKLAVLMASNDCWTRAKEKRLMGEQQVQAMLLESTGWSVVHVSLTDWGQAKTRREQAAYLQGVITNALKRQQQGPLQH